MRKNRYDRTRPEEEEFLQSHRSVQEEKAREEQTVAQKRTEAIKTMLRGVIFGILFLLADIGYRKYRFTGTRMETVFYVITMVTMLATLQIPMGLYQLIKTLWEDEVPHNRRGR